MCTKIYAIFKKSTHASLPRICVTHRSLLFLRGAVSNQQSSISSPSFTPSNVKKKKIEPDFNVRGIRWRSERKV
jgi:hypothetical protein